jgi:ferric-dicitrate binding protein FerR (iron transport regulator)
MTERFAVLIDAYLDGRLEGEQAERMLTYLQSSPGAMPHLRAMAVLDHDLRQQAQPTADAKRFRDAVLAHRAAPHAQSPRPGRVTPPRRPARRLKFPRRTFPLAAAAMLMVGLGLIAALANQQDSATTSGNASIARITTLDGWVRLEHGDDIRTVALGDLVNDGDRLVTGDASRVSLRLQDGTHLHLDPSTWLSLPSPDGARARLEHGAVEADVTPQAANASPILSTATATIRVLGTRFRVSLMEDATTVQVSHGLVEVRTQDLRSFQVPAGESLRLTPSGSERLTTLDLRLQTKDPWQSVAVRTPSSSGATTLPPTDALGARTDLKREATGRFRTEQRDGRWWAVTPDGHPMYVVAMSSVSHAAGRNDPALIKRYGNELTWARSMRDLLTDHDFPILGTFSDHQLFRRVDAPRGRATPQVVRMEIATAFSGKWVYRNPQLRNITGSIRLVQMIAPLLPGFSDAVRAWTNTLTTDYDPDSIVAVVTDQLPDQTLNWDGLRMLAKNDAVIAAVLERWLADHGWTWDTAPGRSTLRRACLVAYRDTVHAAIRATLPKAVVVGQVMKLQDLTDPLVTEILGRDVDAVGINLIGAWLENAEVLRQASKASGRPLWVDGFYAKGADSGLPNHDGRGFEVRTQADRGRFYQHLVLTMIESRVVIGWQWFRFEDVGEDDRDPTRPYVTNKGVVNALGMPYQELLDAMRRVNRLRYVLSDQGDARP